MAKYIINQRYVLDTSSYEGFAYDGINKELEIYLSDVDQERLGWKSLGLRDVVPYAEVQKDIENEVWEFAGKMISTSGNEVSEMWGCATNFGEVMHNTTYSEAKAKYDEWKKEKEDEATMKEVTALAEKIGIHKLYSMVKEIRGE